MNYRSPVLEIRYRKAQSSGLLKVCMRWHQETACRWSISSRYAQVCLFPFRWTSYKNTHPHASALKGMAEASCLREKNSSWTNGAFRDRLSSQGYHNVFMVLVNLVKQKFRLFLRYSPVAPTVDHTVDGRNIYFAYGVKFFPFVMEFTRYEKQLPVWTGVRGCIIHQHDAAESAGEFTLEEWGEHPMVLNKTPL